MKHLSAISLVLVCASLLGCGAKTDVRGPFDDVNFPDAGPPRGGHYGFAGCTPGRFVLVACGARGLGRCSDDPVLHVCDASRSTPERCGRPVTELGFNDDAEGLCSAIEVLCPTSGQLSVRARRFGSEDDPVDCQWDTRER